MGFLSMLHRTNKRINNERNSIEIDKLNGDIDKYLAELCTKGAIIKQYENDIGDGALVKMPAARNRGDKIYFVAKDIIREGMQDTAVVKMYADTIYMICRLTVNHIAYIDGLTYYVTMEADGMQIYTGAGNIFEEIEDAIQYMRKMIPSNINSEIVTEYNFDESSRSDIFTFTMPVKIGTILYEEIKPATCDDDLTVHDAEYIKLVLDSYTIWEDNKVYMNLVKYGSNELYTIASISELNRTYKVK